MAISAAQVKQLRDQTGAGFMECKTALEEAGGDIETAITILRKKGVATAARKAGRVAREGVIGAHLSDDRHAGALVEVNCETDFVAKTEQFKDLVQRLAAHIVAHRPGRVRQDEPGELAALFSQPVHGYAGNWEQFVAEKIAQTGENIVVRRLVCYQGDYCDAYIHAGGKVGVLVELRGIEAPTPALAHLARDVAMHIAASDPRYVRPDEVTAADLAREREIYREQALKEGKPAGIVDKIVEGKLLKFYSEVCLYEQAFIRDPNITVGKLIASQVPGGRAAVRRFTRYRLGE